MNELFFELLRVAIGRQDSLSQTPSESQWLKLYEMAQKQALLGCCFFAVKELSVQKQVLPRPFFLKWLAVATRIQQRNELMNKRSSALQKKVSEAGFQSLILKGQGNQRNYAVGCKNREGDDFASLRHPGDIDIWLKGSKKKILEWVNSIAPTNEVTWLHAQFHVFKDTEVEVHFAPTYMRNPLYNHRLQRWFNDKGWNGVEQLELNEGTITVPNDEFNVVFQLLHIFRHLFGEGIGLRQILDFYFLLMVRNSDSVKEKNEEVIHILRRIGLHQFASGLMWILGDVLYLEKEKMVCKPDEKLGRMILEDVMMSGNFGHDDERKKTGETYLGKFLRVNRENLRYFWYFPSEVLCTPFFRMWHKSWKLKNGYR